MFIDDGKVARSTQALYSGGILTAVRALPTDLMDLANTSHVHRAADGQEECLPFWLGVWLRMLRSVQRSWPKPTIPSEHETGYGDLYQANVLISRKAIANIDQKFAFEIIEGKLLCRNSCRSFSKKYKAHRRASGITHYSIMDLH